jgi:hypothetical protein
MESSEPSMPDLDGWEEVAENKTLTNIIRHALGSRFSCNFYLWFVCQ